MTTGRPSPLVSTSWLAARLGAPELAVIDVTPQGLVVTDMVAGLSEAELQAKTGARLRFAPGCRRMLAEQAAA